MNATACLAISALALLTTQATGTFREHLEFSAQELWKVAPKLIEEVTTERSRGVIAKDRGFSAWVSLSTSGLYKIDFVTRFEGNTPTTRESFSHQSISFQTVTNPEFADKLSSEHEEHFTNALCSTGPFVVRNSVTKEAESKNIVSSIQRVECEVISKEEVLKLLQAFFAEFPSNMRLLEDEAQ